MKIAATALLIASVHAGVTDITARSIRAWQKSEEIARTENATFEIEARDISPWQLYTEADLREFHGPDDCKAALTSFIQCDPYLMQFAVPVYRGSLENETFTSMVCEAKCGRSLTSYYNLVGTSCKGYNVSDSIATLLPGRIWSGYNETCVKDVATGEYCNEIIDDFTLVDTIEQMPDNEICSYCYVERLSMMQRTTYSIYDERYQADLIYVNQRCKLNKPTAIPPPAITQPETPDEICVSDTLYTTVTGDTCDSISSERHLSSAALFMANPGADLDCSAQLPAGISVCIPLSCERTYQIQPDDTCFSIERHNRDLNVSRGDVKFYNPWINIDCSNLQQASVVYGHVLCLSPQNGDFIPPEPGSGAIPGQGSDGYTWVVVDPPADATVAEGTTLKCGRWHVAAAEDTCATLCLEEAITIDLLLLVNPSLGAVPAGCTGHLQQGAAYCAGPNYYWNKTIEASPPTTTVPPTTTTALPTTTTSPPESQPTTSLTPSTDGSCSDGVTCLGSTFGDCCSEYGFCGSSDAYCGTGCQPAFGTCSIGGGGGAPISTDGTCGGELGASCLGSAFGDCCSEYGWCGSTTGYCGTGCQSAFGTCQV